MARGLEWKGSDSLYSTVLQGTRCCSSVDHQDHVERSLPNSPLRDRVIVRFTCKEAFSSAQIRFARFSALAGDAEKDRSRGIARKGFA